MTIKVVKHNNLGDLVIRPALIFDVPAVHEAETKAYNYPWSEKLIHDCVAVGYNCWLIEHNKQVIAYAIYRLAAGEAHLFNIAVIPKYQNKGVGRIFLSFLLDLMRNQKASNVIMEVRVSNMAARKLYASFGFAELGIRKDYYPDKDGTREDGINLELKF